MSGDDLKSAEKRAADAAMEKENMRVAMTATEQKAISTTYVSLTIPPEKATFHQEQKRDLIPHPHFPSERMKYGVFFAFMDSTAFSPPPPSFSMEYELKN